MGRMNDSSVQKYISSKIVQIKESEETEKRDKKELREAYVVPNP